MLPLLAAALSMTCAVQDGDPTPRIMERIDAELQEYRRRLVGEIRRTILEELERARAGQAPKSKPKPKPKDAPKPEPDSKPKGESRVLLGISVDDFTDAERRALDVPGGLKIADVRGPAKAAGMRAGDILLEIGGKPVTERNIVDLLSRYAPGDTAKLTVLREGSRKTLNVTFAGRED